MSKIEFIGKDVSVAALLAHIAEWKGIEAVVAVVKVNDRWCTCWSSNVTGGSLSMAALKLMTDVQCQMHDRPTGWTMTESGDHD